MRHWLTRAQQHVAVRAARRRLELLRRRRLELPPRRMKLDGKLLLAVWLIVSLFRPRLATVTDLYGVALLLLLTLVGVEVPGWLRWPVLKAWCRYFFADLHGGNAGGRWKHFRCRLDGHLQEAAHIWCSRCQMKLHRTDVDRKTRTCRTCGVRPDYVPASESCTFCGDDLTHLEDEV